MPNPRIVVAVSVDGPTAGSHFGGQVSGPVFFRIVGDTLRELNVPPDMPVKQMVVTDDSNSATLAAAKQPANTNNANTAKKFAVSSNTKTHPGVVR
jgi:cell division protein FtsI (penicillin-binding protein 3)